ncbi:hypothetical protein EB796_013955 [Bugula neritina]|uniref:Uncharacterized protein n=1 Tax=Bugula neritina TaxID=10212 RepID=A0A7J7JN04_BUGNE|nr:hypothetical protein EB796_013955 [Bugula neritina]
MADKAAFESLVDIMRVLQKPEFQRLMASNEMREAIEVSEIPLLQTLYEHKYAEIVSDKSYNMTYNFIWVMSTIVPAVVLIFLFALLTRTILRNLNKREVTREEKKRIRQLKKENAEAQRRLQQTKIEKKRS